MEVLINIIIVLVIIFAIMKRMRDVARKGGDITGPSSSPPMSHGWPEPAAEPEPFPEEEEGPFEEPYRRPEPYRGMRQVETPRRTFAEKVLKYEEEKKETYFASPETEKPGEYQPAIRPVSMAARSQGKVMHHRKGEFSICPALSSCKSELVRGIILSEILGKPIALRRENRW